MPVILDIARFSNDMAVWWRHLHQTPELAFDCRDTAAFVTELLLNFGMDEVHDGITHVSTDLTPSMISTIVPHHARPASSLGWPNARPCEPQP